MKGSSRTLIVIPARFASTRLPGKPLAVICGKPMVQHVYERARAAKGVQDVIVATDNQRIIDVVNSFGGKAMMTSPNLKSGTDRVAAVARQMDADVYVNVQGDEPLIDPKAIELAIEPFRDDAVQMSTLMTKLNDESQFNNPNTVKVVVDRDGFAIYFSRSLIPYPRSVKTQVYKHLGLYAYRKDFLLKLADWPQTPLELSESLEQLRVLENGYTIKVVETDYDSVSVDTPEDLMHLNQIIYKQGNPTHK
jgi:3-deoxy-manno-octulosonate cytidylyltransferase (CMP-KDO synthetase)